MAYLPRPDAERTTQDVDEIYTLAAEALKRALSPEERRKAFHTALLRAYHAGIDAQRETMHVYGHERPTPVPPAPNGRDTEDPGTLPAGRRVVQDPLRPFTPRPWKPTKQ